MKRIVALMLIVIMLLSVAACGKTEAPAASGGSSEKAPAVEAPAEGFSWDMASGEKITVMFNQHPYAESIITKIEEFEELTGIKVEHSLTPEENYFDKLTIALSSQSGDPDLFMTGVYQLWEYAPAGYVQDLDEFLNNPDLMDADYNVDDFYDGIIGGLRWDGVAGHKVGSGPLWALPLGFESNVMAYNKVLFDENGYEIPVTTQDLLDLCTEIGQFGDEASYPLAIRGARNWGTIHPGYMTTFANYGAVDFEIEDGRLVSKVNSPEAVAMTQMWVDLIEAGGAPGWSSYTWYQAGSDFGAGQAAMLFDATCNGYFQNVEGASKEAGNLAWCPPPVLNEGDDINANLWTWSMAINANSKHKMASWLFLQYFTSPEYQKYSMLDGNCADPPRQSVFEDPAVQELMGTNTGYLETFEKSVPGTTIQFTPQPHFFETTTEWAATLQDIVAGKYGSVQEGMDALKEKMDEIVKDVPVE